MTNELSPWDDVRRLADELEVQIHLAGMEARDRWRALQPRIVALEQTIAKSSGDSVKDELAAVRDSLRALRDDIYGHARGNFTRGW